MPLVTYLGHSGFILKCRGTTLVIDPFLTGNPLAARKPEEIDADYVLLTHAHGDHFGDTIAIARRRRAHVIANHEIVQYCSARGVDGTGMNLGGSAEFPFGRVKMTLAHHSSSFPDGTYGGNPAGLLLTVDDRKIHHAGDTALTQDMAMLAEESIDVAFLPIGDVFTMGMEDAARAVALIRPKSVVPIHYDTFPPIRVDTSVFRNLCARHGVECIVMAPGQDLEV